MCGTGGDLPLEGGVVPAGTTAQYTRPGASVDPGGIPNDIQMDTLRAAGFTFICTTKGTPMLDA